MVEFAYSENLLGRARAAWMWIFTRNRISEVFFGQKRVNALDRMVLIPFRALSLMSDVSMGYFHENNRFSRNNGFALPPTPTVLA